MNPLPGARVTLVSPEAKAPYTGMLPGFVAEHYRQDELEIDLVKLARFAGARLISDSAVDMDLGEKTIGLGGGRRISYDVASINVGARGDLDSILGFDKFGTPARPLGRFAAAWAERLEGFKSGSPAKIAIIGGGVAGVELALAMDHRLRQEGVPEISITILESDRLLSGLNAAGARFLRQRLMDRGVSVLEGVKPVAITPRFVELQSGPSVQSKFTVAAAGASPHPWLSATGLRLENGYVAVNRYLQSETDKSVFAAGDCAHMVSSPRPKAGVFAVRQADVLAVNLRAALKEDSSMRIYRPQRYFMKLVSLGERSAYMERGLFRKQGPKTWRWKDRIDRRFMEQFRDYPAMSTEAVVPSDMVSEGDPDFSSPVCGGCGAKVGSRTLARSLAKLPAFKRRDVVSDLADDSAIITMGKFSQAISTDQLRAFTLDPGLLAEVAAVHALGDIWAMGAEVQTGLATVTLPMMGARMQERWLDEIMSAASRVFLEAGGSISGGHTSLGAELSVGFAVTGLLKGKPNALGSAKPGEALILSKPLGSGVLLAAEMRLQADGADLLKALELMRQPQGAASRIFQEFQATAMTDVTGFGLAGHLAGLCLKSGLQAVVEMDSVPLMPGALGLSERGVRATVFTQNRMIPQIAAPEGALPDLMFDPQTAGGLLAAVPVSKAGKCLDSLRSSGYAASQIGRLESGPAAVRFV